MKDLLTYLKEKLWNYIIEYNPELMFDLQEHYGVRGYLEKKIEGIIPVVEELKEGNTPLYAIREECMKKLTEDLRPSKYRYLMDILEDEFKPVFTEMQESGTLTYEVVTMLEAFGPLFETLDFCEEKVDDRLIRYAVMAQVDEYLKKVG